MSDATAAVAPATAILSMLHEPADAPNSATRLFRQQPVLAWTLARLSRSKHVRDRAVLCWEDQLPAVQAIADQADACVLAKGPRAAVGQLDAVTAARRWSDGWRGGLLRTCEFDRGFHAAWFAELAAKLSTTELVLVDPSAGLVDWKLIDSLIEHAAAHPQWPLVFSQAAPGLSGTFIRAELLQQLTTIQTHPGRFLHYNPEQPSREPIAETNCAPIPAPLARTAHRFTLDSSRQLRRLAQATQSLNGELPVTPAEGLLRAMNSVALEDALPREILLELTTRRSTRPVFAPAGHLTIERPDLSLGAATQLFKELSASDDVRLTFGGVGDPLLSASFFDVLDVASASGVKAIQVQTDLLEASSETIDRIARSSIDVLTVHIPATSASTYLSVMGVDGLARVLDNVQRFVERRYAAGKAVPILVPLFTKCRENLDEMETWYDKWLAAVGTAVIAGASDYAGQIPDHAVADMSPPARRACGRIASRLSILSDGQMVSCELDATSVQSLGQLGKDRLTDVWTGAAEKLRADHRRGEWGCHSLCAKCREWHRP